MRKVAALLVVAVLIVVFGGIFGGKYWMDQRAAALAATRSYPPVSVQTATASVQPWIDRTSVVGTLRAVSGTQITAQIAGNVTRIAFQSGAHVHRGELLVQLDDSSQRAQLQADEARLQLAQSNLKRAHALFAQHAGSESDLQTAEAADATARAAVAGDQATLKKLAITAPFTGVVGIREVSLGQYVSPGTAIVDLQSNDPLLLDFSLPQSALGELAKGQAVAFGVNAYPQQKFVGKVTAIAARVDPQTRTVAIQATLSNQKNLLRPGMYGNVQLTVGAPQRGVVVPTTAITYSTFGDNVFVVAQDKKRGLVAHQRIVQVRDQRAQHTLIATGLKAGDVVVTVGQNKLRDGAPIVVHNAP